MTKRQEKVPFANAEEEIKYLRHSNAGLKSTITSQRARILELDGLTSSLEKRNTELQEELCKLKRKPLWKRVLGL